MILAWHLVTKSSIANKQDRFTDLDSCRIATSLYGSIKVAWNEQASVYRAITFSNKLFRHQLVPFCLTLREKITNENDISRCLL